jgi:NAD(P)-dependent dehydrogenase (short-subunit alcohol dehydrogenase family)
MAAPAGSRLEDRSLDQRTRAGADTLGPLYGRAMAAIDKLATDMAHEVQPHGVTCVSPYPGSPGDVAALKSQATA